MTASWELAAASAIHGLGHAIGGAWYFGAVFGAISVLAQIAAYSIGIRPTMNYAPAPHLRITRFQLLTVFNRTVGYGVLAWRCAAFVHPASALGFGLRFGLTIGLVTWSAALSVRSSSGAPAAFPKGTWASSAYS